MTIIDILLLLLQLMGAAILACWIAYQSTVIQKIKSMLYLCEDQELPRWKPWFKPFGWLFAEFRELLNCCFCTSFWLGLSAIITTTDFSLWQSVLYACLTIAFVEAYRKFTL